MVKNSGLLGLFLGVMILAGPLPAANAATQWIAHYQFSDGATLPPGEGALSGWAWAPAGRAAWVSVGGSRIEIPREGSRGDGYVWRSLGALELPRGERLAIESDEEVAAIALSDASGYDPAEEMRLTRVLQQPGRVDDRRHEIERSTNTVFTMPRYETREAWEAKAELIRKRILVGSGLSASALEEERTPLNANIFGRIERDGYSVEKVHFDAWPGFLVTGNLYRPFPLPEGKKIPAVLAPHGHWEKGRLEDSERGSVPARCITLARMGAAVFSYDTLGNNDSLQFSTHGFENPDAALTGLQPFALHLWSAIRGVDFLESLPEVDQDRIGCTGASGGGTQTFALTAVDKRIKVSAPVNMISCSMQGGCTCENAPLIRLDNSNMEIGAMMAPRPLLMVSATGDWTRETPRIEYPSIRGIYELYGAADKVETVQIDADHNYNQASREAMYRFFAKHLFGYEGYEDYTEPAYKVEADGDLRVFPDGKLPEGYLKDDALLAHLRGLLLDPAELAKERAAIVATPVAASDVESERLSTDVVGIVRLERWVIRHGAHEAVPLLLALPRDQGPNPVVVHAGEAPLSLAEIGKQVAQGRAVAQVTPFGEGEYIDPFEGPQPYPKPGAFSSTFLRSAEAQTLQNVAIVKAFLELRRDLVLE